MKTVIPQVFLVGQTRIHESGLKAYLDYIGQPGWETDAPSDIEKLIEVYGRLCYRSFDVGMNANLTKIREGNGLYINNILKSLHGSVLEHTWLNFIFVGVSRIFTHELVRHRPTAISQESLRFVRLTELKAWVPLSIQEDEEAVTFFVESMEALEKMQAEFIRILGLDKSGLSFSKKKAMTSLARRLAPDGLATSIGWSTNLREMRWVLEARTQPWAEEEIRHVFNLVGELIVPLFPNVLGDFEQVIQEDKGKSWVPKYHKV